MARNKFLSFTVPFLFAAAAVLTVPVSAAAPLTIRAEQEYTIRGGEEDYKKDGLFASHIENADGNYLLDDVQFTIKEQTPVTKKTQVTKTVTSNVPEEENYKPQETVTEDGITYTLQKVSMTTKTEKDAYTQPVSDTETFTAEETIPQTESVSAVNESTGETATIICSLSSVTEKGGSWIPGSIPVTYHNYGADSYSFAGYEIPNTEGKPALAGYEDVIAEDAGYDPALWDITDIEWSGEAYDTGSEICRNAVASGSQWVPSYEAVYTGEIHTDAVTSDVYTCTYTGVKEEQEEDMYDFQVRATATYRIQEQAGMNGLTKVLISLGVVAAVLIAVISLLVLAVKRKETGEEKKE